MQSEGARFALVQYGTAVETIIGLTESTDRYEARFHLQNVPIATPTTGEESKLIPALMFAVGVELLGDGVRNNVPKAVIQIINEPSDDDQESLQNLIDELTNENGLVILQIRDSELVDDTAAAQLSEHLCKVKPPIITTTPISTTQFFTTSEYC